MAGNTGAAKKTASAPKTGSGPASAARNEAPGTTKPEPKNTDNGTTGGGDGDATAPAPEVQEQRTEEQEKALADAAAAQVTEANGPATPAEKGQQTRAAGDVRAQAQADAESRAGLDEGQGGGQGEDEGESHDEGGLRAPLSPGYDTQGGPVQEQRRAEAEARIAATAARDADLSDDDRVLLAAAPGGARTALTDGKEGSTKVTHTAAQSRPPLSGPLDAPVTGIENYAATEDDPDNRVYADEAGPRDVFDDTEGSKARYIGADGKALSFDDIFETQANRTYAIAKVRVYEVFRFPNTAEDGKRLAYPEGKRVPIGEAENVRQQISVHSPIL